MKEWISDVYHDFQILNPQDDAHYFFAYYDMRATGENGKHLCHRVPFMDRLQTADDRCELGYLEDGRFVKFAETTAWNFQQGAMLQYHPTLEHTVYYNVCENGTFKTVTHNYRTGEKRYADRATACISPDGKWGIGINFGRIFAFRPGYGYAGFTDPYAAVNAPAEDGAFLVDMETGTSKQIVCYDQLAPLAGFDGEKQKILINHVTFNTTSTRFLMLVRNFMTPACPLWSTSLVVSDLEGNCRTVLKNTYVSHYCWLSENQLLAHCTVEGTKKSMYVINVDTGAWVEYDMPYFHEEWHNPDIHCNCSPDGNYIIGDGYELTEPDGTQYRALLAYSPKTGQNRELLRVKTVTPHGITDIRTDLHARFVWGGKAITFDTTQNGRRDIVKIDLRGLNF